VIRNVERILGIELLAAEDGLDLRRPLASGRGVEAAMARLRAKVPPLTEDRILHVDFEAVDALVRDGSLVAAAESAAGSLVGL
jgi:histidine ammonia-lyase